MTEPTEPLDLSSAARSMTSLDDIDTEIARLALLCQIQILDPGACERAFLIIVCTSAAVTPFMAKMQICIQMSVGLPFVVAAASKDVQTPPLAGVQL